MTNWLVVRREKKEASFLLNNLTVSWRGINQVEQLKLLSHLRSKLRGIRPSFGLKCFYEEIY